MRVHEASKGRASQPAITARPKDVSVNGVAIPRAAIARETQNHPAAKPIEAWLAAAHALVVRELLLQEARRLGIAAQPLEDGEGRRETDDEALVRALVEREVRTPQADEAACRRYYERNGARFRSPDLYEVRHILVPAPAGDTEARQAARARAEALIEALRREPSLFGDLAKAESACPSGQTGGSLGQIGPGQTVPEFEQGLARSPVGAVAPSPIESRYGFHVVVVDRRIAGRDLPFELVQQRIAAWLDEKVHRTAIRQYIGILAGRADIRGIEFAGNASPLVQ
jgi:peptidyl-prolyl cis-trans isomerase C